MGKEDGLLNPFLNSVIEDREGNPVGGNPRRPEPV